MKVCETTCLFSTNIGNLTAKSKETEKKPKFLLPFPLGVYTKDIVRPFPDSTFLLVMIAFIIPFPPFGIWEWRLPLTWDANLLIAHLNGHPYEDISFGGIGRTT